jgi:hypothetical protein
MSEVIKKRGSYTEGTERADTESTEKKFFSLYPLWCFSVPSV